MELKHIYNETAAQYIMKQQFILWNRKTICKNRSTKYVMRRQQNILWKQRNM